MLWSTKGDRLMTLLRRIWILAMAGTLACANGRKPEKVSAASQYESVPSG